MYLGENDAKEHEAVAQCAHRCGRDGYYPGASNSGLFSRSQKNLTCFFISTYDPIAGGSGNVDQGNTQWVWVWVADYNVIDFNQEVDWGRGLGGIHRGADEVGQSCDHP